MADRHAPKKTSDTKPREVLFDELSSILRQIAAANDTEIRQPNCRSAKAAYDPVTGLPDKKRFFDILTGTLLLAERDRTMAAVLFVGIDRFKIINDSMGNHVGDLLLKEVAERLKDCLRAIDVVCRPGREEFMVLLPELKRIEDATIITDRALAAFAHPFTLSTEEIFVTVSIGISMYPFDCNNGDRLIKNAYSAMNRAREEGKNLCRFYSNNISSRAFDMFRMENSLRLAFKRDEFILHYQPLIDVGSGNVSGMEALLRWKHPEAGYVAPADFLPLIDEIDMVEPLSEWVLHTACKESLNWQEQGYPPVKVGINFSPRQIHNRTMMDTFRKTVVDTGIDPTSLQVELTESALVSDVDSTAQVLNSLAAMGVEIAIDDFGTGYSSLTYLKHFPINTLKIDRSFIEMIGSGKNNAAICVAIIAMGHGLRLKVVAEGVETAEQLEFLRGLKCDAVQGFLFGTPQPSSAVKGMLATNHIPSALKHLPVYDAHYLLPSIHD